MSVVRFISDLHFGHKFLADMRGFQDTFYHDEHIIDMWNRTVSKKDTTYILGDLSMHDPSQYEKLARLNGFKKVVGGNHDSGKGWVKELLPYINGLSGAKRYSQKGLAPVILTHIPIHPVEFDYNYNKIQYNIHGHIHAAYVIEDPRYINVSAEVLNYIPKTLKELLNE